MNLLRKLCFIVIAIILPFTVHALTADEAAKKYKEYGFQVVDLVNANNIDVKKIEELVLKQTKYSVFLVQQYQQKHPAGKKLLDIALKQVAVMKGGVFSGLGPLTGEKFAVIEAEWHDLGFTEKMDVGIDMEDEDNEHFTDPLHVALHPIMALRAAMEHNETKSKEMKEAIKSETMEGIEQIDNVLELLK